MKQTVFLKKLHQAVHAEFCDYDVRLMYWENLRELVVWIKKSTDNYHALGNLWGEKLKDSQIYTYLHNLWILSAQEFRPRHSEIPGERIKNLESCPGVLHRYHHLASTNFKPGDSNPRGISPQQWKSRSLTNTVFVYHIKFFGIFSENGKVGSKSRHAW